MNPAEFNPAWTEAEQVDWFLFEFAMIPNEKWCLYEPVQGDKRCAVGHCGVHTAAAICLRDLSLKHLGVEIAEVNDNSDECPEEFRQITTPKSRVLKALEVIAETITKQNNKGKP